MSRHAPRRAPQTPKTAPRRTGRPSTTRRRPTKQTGQRTSPATAGALAGIAGSLAIAGLGGWFLYTCLNERIRLFDRDLHHLSREAKIVRNTLEVVHDDFVRTGRTTSPPPVFEHHERAGATSKQAASS